MPYPKFIIQGGKLIMGKVDFHKNLSIGTDKIVGGGWYDYDPTEKAFTFYARSEDFGSVTKEQIQECIDSGNIGSKYDPKSYINHKFYHSDLSVYTHGDRRSEFRSVLHVV